MFFDKAEVIALLSSIFIESLFVIIYGKLKGWNWPILAIIATASTLITHPFVWELFIQLSGYLNFALRSLLLETLVILIEGSIYQLITGYSWPRSLIISLGANVASYGLGLLFYAVRT